MYERQTKGECNNFNPTPPLPIKHRINKGPERQNAPYIKTHTKAHHLRMSHAASVATMTNWQRPFKEVAGGGGVIIKDVHSLEIQKNNAHSAEPIHQTEKKVKSKFLTNFFSIEK